MPQSRQQGSPDEQPGCLGPPQRDQTGGRQRTHSTSPRVSGAWRAAATTMLTAYATFTKSTRHGPARQGYPHQADSRQATQAKSAACHKLSAPPTSQAITPKGIPGTSQCCRTHTHIHTHTNSVAGRAADSWHPASAPPPQKGAAPPHQKKGRPPPKRVGPPTNLHWPQQGTSESMSAPPHWPSRAFWLHRSPENPREAHTARGDRAEASIPRKPERGQPSVKGYQHKMRRAGHEREGESRAPGGRN